MKEIEILIKINPSKGVVSIPPLSHQGGEPNEGHDEYLSEAMLCDLRRALKIQKSLESVERMNGIGMCQVEIYEEAEKLFGSYWSKQINNEDYLIRLETLRNRYYSLDV